MSDSWYRVRNEDDIASPALLVYAERVERNIQRAIDIVRDVQRLRPHVKTHKLAQVVRMHLALGVTKFKCATIAEAEMTAAAGAPDVLLAYQPVGPNIQRLVSLTRAFPQTQFSAVIDDAEIIDAVSAAFTRENRQLNVLVDVDCGMHRTGARADAQTIELYARVSSAPGFAAVGLHAYDGHIHDTDVATRQRNADEAFAMVAGLKKQIEASGSPVPKIVMSGTPTFPMHAKRPEVECSPGTYVFWDFGYAEMLPDLPFELAALLLTRVVSKPTQNRLCLDLGHKAVAAENPHPRVKFLHLPEATAVMHSEEHLVIESPRAGEFRVGDVLYGVPRHICPTVALHNEVVVVRNAGAEERWKVTARDRALTI